MIKLAEKCNIQVPMEVVKVFASIFWRNWSRTSLMRLKLLGRVVLLLLLSRNV